MIKKYKLISIILLVCLLTSTIVYGKSKIDKTGELINVAPIASVGAKAHPKKISIQILTDYNDSKLSNIETLLNDFKSDMLANNMDIDYSIMNKESTISIKNREEQVTTMLVRGENDNIFHGYIYTIINREIYFSNDNINQYLSKLKYSSNDNIAIDSGGSGNFLYSLKVDGTVWKYQDSNLSSNPNYVNTTPKQISGLKNIKKIRVVENKILALDKDNQLWYCDSWSDNPVYKIAGIINPIEFISCGNNSFIVLDSLGKLWRISPLNTDYKQPKIISMNIGNVNKIIGSVGYFKTQNHFIYESNNKNYKVTINEDYNIANSIIITSTSLISKSYRIYEGLIYIDKEGKGYFASDQSVFASSNTAQIWNIPQLTDVKYLVPLKWEIGTLPESYYFYIVKNDYSSFIGKINYYRDLGTNKDIYNSFEIVDSKNYQNIGYDIKSVDTSGLNMESEGNVDNYFIYLSDGQGNDFTKLFGEYYSFGQLNKDFANKLLYNNYTNIAVTPSTNWDYKLPESPIQDLTIRQLVNSTEAGKLFDVGKFQESLDYIKSKYVTEDVNINIVTDYTDQSKLNSLQTKLNSLKIDFQQYDVNLVSNIIDGNNKVKLGTKVDEDLIYGKFRTVVSNVNNTHEVGLKPDGTVWARGNNSYGALGNGTYTSTNITTDSWVQVIGLTDVVMIAIGNNFSLAVKSNGDIYGWGNNNVSQLGIGAPGTVSIRDGTTIQSKYNKPIFIMNFSAETGKEIKNIYCGLQHTLILATDNEAFGWGSNGMHQLVDYMGSNAQYSHMIDLSLSGSTALLGRKISYVAATTYGSEFLHYDELNPENYSWLKIGDAVNSYATLYMNTAGSVIHSQTDFYGVDKNSDFTNSSNNYFVYLSDGQGNDFTKPFGQYYSFGNLTKAFSDNLIEKNVKAYAVTPTSNYDYKLPESTIQDLTIRELTTNTKGQLFDVGQIDQCLEEIKYTALNRKVNLNVLTDYTDTNKLDSLKSNIANIQADLKGYDVKLDFNIVDGNNKLILDGFDISTTVERPIVNYQNNRIYIIDSNGDVWAKGDNSKGMLGLGYTSSYENKFKKIPNLKNVIKIVTDSSTVIALTSEGDVYTWGYNSSTLGTGKEIDSLNTPQKITSNIMDINLRGDMATAITKSYKLYVWGKLIPPYSSTHTVPTGFFLNLEIKQVIINISSGGNNRWLFMLDTNNNLYATGGAFSIGYPITRITEIQDSYGIKEGINIKKMIDFAIQDFSYTNIFYYIDNNNKVCGGNILGAEYYYNDQLTLTVNKLQKQYVGDVSIAFKADNSILAFVQTTTNKIYRISKTVESPLVMDELYTSTSDERLIDCSYFNENTSYLINEKTKSVNILPQNLGEPLTQYTTVKTSKIQAMDFSISKVNTTENKNYLLSISDGAGNDFSKGWGNYYSFGSLTQTFANKLKDNKFTNYAVTAAANYDYKLPESTIQNLTVRQLVEGGYGKGKLFDIGQLHEALIDMKENILSNIGLSSKPLYVCTDESIEYIKYYKDYEDDPQNDERFRYTHDYTLFENNKGSMLNNNTWIKDEITQFDKTGKYVISYQAQDNPSGRILFSNYNKWSVGENQLTLIVHNRPIADFEYRVNNSTLAVTITNNSYDLDHYSEAQKGIVDSKWKWRNIKDLEWNYSDVPSTLIDKETYIVSLEVKDKEGAWSYPTAKIFTVGENHKPIAKFSLQKLKMMKNEVNAITDQSYDPDMDALAEWKWRLLDNNNNLVTDYLGVKPNLSTLVPGIYKLELKVRDNPVIPPTMWSEPYIVEFEITDDLKLAASLSPSPAKRGQRITINAITDGFAKDLTFYFPYEITSLDTKTIFPIYKPITIEDHHVDSIEYYLPMETPYTIDENGNRLRQPYIITVVASKDGQSKNVDLQLDVKGNIYNGIKTELR